MTRRLDLKDAVVHTLQHMPGELRNVYVDLVGIARIVLNDGKGDYEIRVAADTLEHVNRRIRDVRQERR